MKEAARKEGALSSEAAAAAGIGNSVSMALFWCAILLLAFGVGTGSGEPAMGNFSSCRPHVSWGNCCTLEAIMRNPPVSKSLKEYLEQNPLPKKRRIRQAAHLVDEAYMEKYNRAYELLRALPENDPRSHFQQANLHCLYGSPDVRSQLGHPDKDYMVHKTWFLMPFHRWFEFFHERILAKLLGDEEFALPFWNWDNQRTEHPWANVFPRMYSQPEKYPGLFDHERHKENTMTVNRMVQLQFEKVLANVVTEEADVLRKENNGLLWDILCNRSVVDRDAFYSPAFRAGENRPVLSGALEAVPHAAIHVWTGNHNNAQWEDMGRGYSAARDPIFHAHHNNLDRIWNIWLKLHGKEHIDDPDYLNAEFLFYDENAELVRVSVAESLNFERFMYEYQETELTWVNYANRTCDWTVGTSDSSSSVLTTVASSQQSDQDAAW